MLAKPRSPARRSMVLIGALWCLWLLLIVYASCYPFVDWRDQGLPVGSFVLNPWPRYWTPFDIYANVLGYVPFGMLCVGLFFFNRWPFSNQWANLSLALLVPCALSFSMESVQVYLSQRVASNVDWGLNSAGGFLGAILGLWLLQKSALQRWSQWAQWQANQSSNLAFLLLLLWPLCLLYPTAIPFGLGQVYPVMHSHLQGVFSGAVIASPNWLVNLRAVLFAEPWGFGFSVFTGFFAPSVLLLNILHAKKLRCLGLVVLWIVGLGALTLSAALSYGLFLALTWLTPMTLYAVGLAMLLSFLGIWVPSKLWYAPLFVCLLISLFLLNLQLLSPYFSDNLHAWESGRFVNFYGFAQWLGWLWPFALLLWCVRGLLRSSKTEAKA